VASDDIDPAVLSAANHGNAELEPGILAQLI
jgi:hypothetical protein